MDRPAPQDDDIMARLGEPGSKADPAGAVGVRERATGKRRGWEVAIFACVAVTTSIAIGRAIENDLAPRPSAATPARPAVEPLAAEAQTPSSRDVAAFDHPTVEPSPAAARVTTAAIRDPVTIEICGYGPVALPPDDPDPVQQLPRGLRSNALEAMRAEMTVSGDPQARAAVLLISLRSNLGGAQEQADLLARQATASQDPAIYAMALEGCRGFVADGAGSCALLNRAQWARLDPDNVAPWLELAAEAHERGEAENEADAMGHAALARRSDGYEELLPGLVERTLLASAPSLRLALALTTARTAQTVWSASRSNHAYEYCASGLAADAVRRRCEAIAEILTQPSVGPAERRTGVAIGRQLGWSQERLNAGREPGSASVESANLPTLGLELSCDDVSRVERWLMAATPETTVAPPR